MFCTIKSNTMRAFLVCSSDYFLRADSSEWSCWVEGSHSLELLINSTSRPSRNMDHFPHLLEVSETTCLPVSSSTARRIFFLKNKFSKLISGKWCLLILICTLKNKTLLLYRIIYALYFFLSECQLLSFAVLTLPHLPCGQLGEPHFVQNPGWLRVTPVRRRLSHTVSLGGPEGSPTGMASHSRARTADFTPWPACTWVMSHCTVWCQNATVLERRLQVWGNLIFILVHRLTDL